MKVFGRKDFYGLHKVDSIDLLMTPLSSEGVSTFVTNPSIQRLMLLCFKYKTRETLS
jgi:hypothetical protein